MKATAARKVIVKQSATMYAQMFTYFAEKLGLRD